MKTTSRALLRPCFSLACLVLASGNAHAQIAPRGGAPLAFDFNEAAWPRASASGSGGVTARLMRGATGTIDTYKGQPSGAMSLSADFSKASKNARAGLSSGPLEVRNAQSNLAKLTLSFDAWASDVRPIRVVVQSLGATGKVTGSRFSTVLPPIASTWHRYSLDLDQTTALDGAFDPRSPRIQLSWQIIDADGTIERTAEHVLRVDNVSLASPALYVSATGSDAADGKSEKTAFATIQKAVDAARPGDVISVMDGDYALPSAVSITKSGRPAAYITLRAYPGARPTLRPSGWEALKFTRDASYWEVRGLTIRGNRPELKLEDALADGLLKEKDGKPYYGDALYNGNGISIDGRNSEEGARPHHIRIIGNTVVDNAGGGISAINCDFISVEGNVVRDNCHFMRYAGSGISIFRSWDFDGSRGHKMFVLNNVSSGNRCFVPWGQIGKISDGNGIIIDDNINSQSGASKIPYEGRTLIQNNLSFGNGGSGIHAYASRFVDIVNNTAYLNAQSPELVWRQIFAGGKCDDVRIINNVFYATKGKPLDLSTDKSSTNIVYSHNLFFGAGDNNVKSGGGLGAGGGSAPAGPIDLGTNVQADPRFVSASLDPAVADFRLAPNSPGIDKGAVAPGLPLNDLLGHQRPQGAAPDMGAYEMPARG